MRKPSSATAPTTTALKSAKPLSLAPSTSSRANEPVTLLARICGILFATGISIAAVALYGTEPSRATPRGTYLVSQHICALRSNGLKSWKIECGSFVARTF
jgi:hypothetical protein